MTFAGLEHWGFGLFFVVLSFVFITACLRYYRMRLEGGQPNLKQAYFLGFFLFLIIALGFYWGYAEKIQ